MPIALRHKDLADAAERATEDKEQQVVWSGNRQPKGRVRSERNEARIKKIEDDRARPLRRRQPPDLDHGSGGAVCAGQRRSGAERRSGCEAAGEHPGERYGESMISTPTKPMPTAVQR